MALTIEGAGTGYDVSGVSQVCNTIDSTIERASTEVRKGLNGLNGTVDKIWVGVSADKFKSNMGKDVDKIATAMTKAKDTLISEIKSAISAMQQTDANLLKKR